MSKKIAASLLLSLSSFAAIAGPIYNGNEYFLSSSFGSWATAENEAIAAGGHLVAINDAAEQNFLVGAFGGSERLWIGLSDSAVEGAFAWSNGDALTYTNWAGGEPNDYLGEDYALMNWSSAGDWNDCANNGILCSGGFRGIIEIANVPEPATTALLGLGLLGMSLRGRKNG